MMCNLDEFYRNILLEFGVVIVQEELFQLFNTNLKYSFKITFNNKQMILENDEYIQLEEKDKLLKTIFHPLSKHSNLCSFLVIEDSIHLKLTQYIQSISQNVYNEEFNKYINNLDYKFRNEFVSQQLQGDMSTINKWNNICNILSATYFAKNLISFSIDSSSSSETVLVKFHYPLYKYLNIIKSNTICGIQLKDSEIDLFKEIYESYIIKPLEQIFIDPIKIPIKSNEASKFYVYMKIYLKIKEFIKNECNINHKCNGKFDIDKTLNCLNELSDNMYSYRKDEIFRQIQKNDQESYEIELQLRKESEPNWFLIKDNRLQKNTNNQQIEVIRENNQDTYIKKLEKRLERRRDSINKRIDTLLINENVNRFLENYQRNKNNLEWKDIFYWQDLVLDILRSEGGSLWFDDRINKYCFRSKIGGKIRNKNREKISDLLTRALKEKITKYLNRHESEFLSNYAIEIVLVSKLKGVESQKLNNKEKASNAKKILLFENEILTIDDDVFEINKVDEFFKNDRDLFYTRNRFIPGDYLRKRYTSRNKDLNSTQILKRIINNVKQTFIEKFIYSMVKENQSLFEYIMNWLSYYFQNLQKTKTALVLLGDQEVTQDIFWKIIIKEIFGKQYCTTINDKEQDTSEVFDIARDKLFFHIGDIDDVGTKFDDITLALIVKELLLKSSVVNTEEKEIEIHGQMIITTKNPAPYLKKALSKCTVIEVNDIDTMKDKLDCEDETELEGKILDDLDSFADKLSQYNVIIENAQNKLDTVAREVLKSNITPNVDKDTVSKNINLFINAIKDKDLNYFDKVKDTKDKKGKDIYEEVKYAFEKDDGYFIGQDLYLYYNAIYGQSFKTNKSLMDMLKDKDNIFKQETKTLKILTIDKKEEVLFQAPKTSKETGNKELYKIKDYKLAKDLIIPSKSIITSSQDNINKFSYEDNETIKLNEENKDKKARKKKADN